VHGRDQIGDVVGAGERTHLAGRGTEDGRSGPLVDRREQQFSTLARSLSD